jgi:N-glycosylase/DNA lyase
MKIYELDNKIVVEDINNFNLTDIFECGQCFRFNQTLDVYEGIAYGKYLRAYHENNKIYFETTF